VASQRLRIQKVDSTDPVCGVPPSPHSARRRRTTRSPRPISGLTAQPAPCF